MRNDQEITSPFFPSFYPRDFTTEHILKCDFESCRIRIEFSDFQISRSSSMEFTDTNGERFYVTGSTFRPPILISSGATVNIKFNANGGQDLGYRAKISFITNDEANNPDNKAQTNCGGLVETIGGAITMMNMLRKESNETTQILFDCIWIIRPPKAYQQVKTHLSIQVQKFDQMETDSEISIYQGTTSDKQMLDLVRSSSLGYSSVPSRMLVVPLVSGLYVRLRGKFNRKSKLAIAYTTFGYSSKFYFIFS